MVGAVEIVLDNLPFQLHLSFKKVKNLDTSINILVNFKFEITYIFEINVGKKIEHLWALIWAHKTILTQFRENENSLLLE